ncbi:MAG: transporter ATP-binding protein [Actinomycetia bacterium]|nr:transporter ATP-binding protein [Actinomycetes bacterium]
MTTPAVELHGVGKRYWKIHERSLLRSLVPFGPPNRTELWALRDANLLVEPGETLGIIGRNGAGKSTMLRLLAGVTRPTTGKVVTRGRIAPLLSVGVGFHQEMTGRENIYVNGMLLGFSKARITRIFDDIVDFAQLGDFIDTPVKFYSSGMYMRLGFSVAIHSEPDVLLVDEVLAVGDVGFRLRSFDRMRAMQRSGAALVFVSHWLQAVQVLCPRTVCMHQGRIAFDGPTEGAIARHHELLSTDDGRVADDRATAVRVLRRELMDADGLPVGTVRQDDVLTYRVDLRFEEAVQSPQVLFQVIAEDSTLTYQMQTALGDQWRTFSAGEESSIVVRFQPRFGGGGTFRAAVVVTNIDSSITLLHDEQGPAFFVEPRRGVVGVCDLQARIAVDNEDRTDQRSLRFGDEAAAVEGV